MYLEPKGDEVEPAKVELNLDAMMQESANNIATLNGRCMALAGQLGAAQAKIKKLEEELEKKDK